MKALSEVKITVSAGTDDPSVRAANANQRLLNKNFRQIEDAIRELSERIRKLEESEA